MKVTRKSLTSGPRLEDLIGTQRVVDLASKARIAVATFYRAMRGTMPHTPQVLAIAAVLGRSEAEVRAAIQRSKGAA